MEWGTTKGFRNKEWGWKVGIFVTQPLVGEGGAHGAQRLYPYGEVNNIVRIGGGMLEGMRIKSG